MFDPMPRDVGRMGESDDLADRYRFRTPMLRNVALTAPYGHNGTIASLTKMVEHHINPIKSLANWEFVDVALPSVPWLADIDFVIWQDDAEMKRLRDAVDTRRSITA